MIRLTPHCLAFLCVLAASFAVAGRAHAGSGFGTQFEAGVCANSDPTTAMNDPNLTAFFNAGSVAACKRLCQQTAADCKLFAKRTESCRAAFANSIFKYAKINCSVVNGDPRACIGEQSSALKSRLSAFRGDLAEAITSCESWDATCEQTCQPD